MTTPTKPAVESVQKIPMYGSPCAGCGRPAHAVFLLSRGRVVSHSPQDQQPCQVTGLAGGAS